MKTTIAVITTVIGLSAGAAQAEQLTAEDCIVYNELATKVMEARQAGVPMGDVMAISGGDQAVEFVIMEAYQYPYYNTEGYKRRAVVAFADVFYLWCEQSRRG